MRTGVWGAIGAQPSSAPDPAAAASPGGGRQRRSGRPRSRASRSWPPLGPFASGAAARSPNGDCGSTPARGGCRRRLGIGRSRCRPCRCGRLRTRARPSRARGLGGRLGQGRAGQGEERRHRSDRLGHALTSSLGLMSALDLIEASVGPDRRRACRPFAPSYPVGACVPLALAGPAVMAPAAACSARRLSQTDKALRCCGGGGKGSAPPSSGGTIRASAPTPTASASLSSVSGLGQKSLRSRRRTVPRRRARRRRAGSDPLAGGLGAAAPQGRLRKHLD